MKHEQATEPKADLVSFLGVRRKWVGAALYIFTGCLLVYAGFSTHDALTTDGWKGFKTVRAVVRDTGDCVPLAGASPIVIFCVVEVMMILYGLVKEQIEARQQARIKQHEERGEKRGEERGEKRGEERGEKRGRELERQEWMEWMERRQQADEAGEPFTEPNPAEKHNGTQPPNE